MNHYQPHEVKPAIGKTLLSAELKPDSDTVILKFSDSSELRIYVEGDCCSKSAFYGMEAVSCYGGQVLSIEENVDFPEINKETEEQAYQAAWYDPNSTYRGECLRLGNILVRTTTGTLLLKEINDSNGYYSTMTSYSFSE